MNEQPNEPCPICGGWTFTRWEQGVYVDQVTLTPDGMTHVMSQSDELTEVGPWECVNLCARAADELSEAIG